MAKEPEPFVGRSPATQAVRDEVRYAAASDAKILITGESGVGKEIVARLIHAASRRRHNAFITINCAGVPESLLESELFGHARGSFTGAYRSRTGLIQQSDGGTILLDEAGEMSLRMQSMLLRFLETGEIQRVGADRPEPCVIDARVIAATNRNLLDRISAGEFREDLYYRLNVVHIVIPPLRERREDIPLLFRHLAQACAAHYAAPPPEIDSEALAALTAYDWPGNVRELKNVVERLVLRRETTPISRGELSRALSVGSDVLAGAVRGTADAVAPTPDPAETLLRRIVQDGESFWRVVYDPFMSRDITRASLRQLIAAGLQQTRGNYKVLVRHFNMPDRDYKRFLSFLHKHGCHIRVQTYRGTPTRPTLAPVA